VTLSFAVWLAALLLGGANSPYDEPLHRALYAGGNAVLARNAALLTRLGGGVILTVLALLAFLYLLFRRQNRSALLLIVIFGGRLMVELQKLIIARDRPGVDPHLEAVTSMSFPSGHSANSMITFLAIALLLPVKQRNRAISVGLGLAVALQVGWSRVALGVHWPSDVLGGWSFGIFWIALCMRMAHARPEGEASAPAR
jgi:undecaprenyl-diphosphatase